MNAVSVKNNTIKNNRKIRIFLFFIFLTSILWLIIELSKSYATTVYFRTSIVDVPADKILEEDKNAELQVNVRAPGFTLLKYKLLKHRLKVSLSNMNTIRGKNYVLLNNQLSAFNTQMGSEIEIQRVVRDSLFVTLGRNISKKVPVRSQLKITYKLGYNLTESLVMNPDSVIVSGPDHILDTLNFVTTERRELKDVFEHIAIELPLLEASSNTKIELSHSNVSYRAEVDKFTEGNFKLPVEIINEPDNIRINPFPKEVEVIYQAGISNFSRIDPGSVKIVFDYLEYKKDTSIKFLTPVIVQQSELISSIRLNPARIEFLIQK